MNIKTKYGFGDLLYLKTCPDQWSRIVTGINAYPSGVVYVLSLGSSTSYHYEIEVTDKKDELKALGLN